MKICTKCNQEKNEEDFSFKSKNKKVRRSECKKCVSLYNKEYRENNKNKIKLLKQKHYVKNKTKILEYHKIYHENNPEYRTYYYNTNKEILSDKRKNKDRERYKEKVLALANEKISNGNKGGDWIFYTCKFSNKDITFYKYGITSRNVDIRYSSYSDYNIEIINEIYGDKEYIKALEKKVLIDTKENQFIFPDDIDFGGKSECRNKLSIITV